jgi:hypothetical protein
LANLHDPELLTALIKAWWRLSDAQIRRCRSTDRAWNIGQAEDITLGYIAAFGLGCLQHASHIGLMHSIARGQIGALK